METIKFTEILYLMQFVLANFIMLGIMYVYQKMARSIPHMKIFLIPFSLPLIQEHLLVSTDKRNGP